MSESGKETGFTCENAPALDLGKPAHRRMEAEAVVENVLSSMLGSIEAHLKSPEKRKRPRPEGYTKILLTDLEARGWELREIGQ